ncbi:MAG: metal-dependent transcriptional regulator [Myxococcales bacterium]|nr:metal-dependent transcriptional regulator [Myxococcales bacterium]
MAELSAEAAENYLKQIYTLSLDHEQVKTSRLATALGLSPAAVTEMLKRLDEQKLVRYRPYRGVTLTAQGRKRALRIVRRHRLWEVFLYRVLAVPWAELHEHAERLEHATSDKLANYLDDYLGNPTVDPHGHPIPTREGSVTESKRVRLSTLDAGSTAVITQCTGDENDELMRYLKSVGLVPGARVQVGERAPFGGPIALQVEGTERMVGAEAARTVLVRVE